MRRIGDKVTLGLVAGVGGCIVALPLDYWLSKCGLSRIPWIERATGVTVSKASHGQVDARVLGVLTSLAMGGICSVGQVYMYAVTGKDSRYLKATGYGFLTWMGVHGLGSRITGAFGPKDSPARASALSLFTNLAHSFLSAKIIEVLGDESVYPPGERSGMGSARMPVSKCCTGPGK